MITTNNTPPKFRNAAVKRNPIKVIEEAFKAAKARVVKYKWELPYPDRKKYHKVEGR